MHVWYGTMWYGSQPVGGGGFVRAILLLWLRY